MWEIKEAVGAEQLDLYIYGDVEGDGYDWWTDEIIRSETSANYFREELGKYPNVTQINVYINSYGGSVFEGTAIYNQLKRHPAKKTVYIDGFACSIASVIAMAGDTVIMPKNALMMVHNMWMGAVGNADALRKAAEDLDVINEAGREAYMQKAGEKLDKERLVEMMDSETWLTAEECIRLGLADQYANNDADMTGASEIMQKIAMPLEKSVQIHKSLAAQLRELTKDKNTEKKQNAEPEREQKQQKPNKRLWKTLAG